MKIIHQPPAPDLEYRVRAPLRLELPEGGEVTIPDWSLVGITYPEEMDIFPRRGQLIIPFQGIDIRFPIVLEKGAGKRELLFKGLKGRERETLAIFYRAILSGQMASTGSIITALDTPVDLVSMGETEEEKEEAIKAQKFSGMRVIVNTCFYFLLGALIIWLSITQIWTSLSSVVISNGRVNAPLTRLSALGDGTLSEILVSEGQSVSKGDILARFNTPHMEARLAGLRADEGAQKRRITDSEITLKRHLSNLIAVRAPLKEAASKAEITLRITKLGVIATPKSALNTRIALHDFERGISRTRGDFHDIRQSFEQKLTDEKDTATRIAAQIARLQEEMKAAVLIAPNDGIIQKLSTYVHQPLRLGNEILIIEDNTPRGIAGWLIERRATLIFPGMEARVSMRTPEGQHHFKATIKVMDVGADPATNKKMGVVVQLAIDNMSIEESRALLLPGTPVEIRALKPWSKWLRFGE